MYFDPKTNRYPYPEDTDKHYLVVKKNDGTVFDENYPYLDNSFFFKFKRFWIRLLLVIIAFPLARIRLGLKIKGKENLRKYKDVIKKGVVSVANHVHMWDYIAIQAAIWPIHPNLLAWAPNVSGENGFLIRMVGGIPIPENNPKATFAYLKAVEKVLTNGGWLHIYPEGSMWEYYAPIRPFKRGSFFFASKFDKPIVPFGFSYRKPGWIRRTIFKQFGTFTLTIGEPIFTDFTMDKKDQEEVLLEKAHDAVCRLAGIDPEKNVYPKVFNNSKRVDYYTSEYGIGYKGSY